jgi:hypothetical protein
MKLFLFSLALSLSLPTFAQSQSFASVSTPITFDDLSEKYQRSPSTKRPKPPGLKKRNIGRNMTIIGGAFVVTGLCLSLSASPNTHYNPGVGVSGNYHYDSSYENGLFVANFGMGLVVPGVILWSNGRRKYKEYKNQSQESLSLHSMGSGFSLRYRF